jgi:hypothetical protein
MGRHFGGVAATHAMILTVRLNLIDPLCTFQIWPELCAAYTTGLYLTKKSHIVQNNQAASGLAGDLGLKRPPSRNPDPG